MPVPPGTPHTDSATGQDEAARDISAELERLVRERTRDLAAENDALRRENAELKRAEGAFRERAEGELTLSERNLAASQAIAHVGSYSWDLEKDLLIWSDELYRILGLAPHERPAAYDTYTAFIHPDDREEAVRKIRSTIEDGTPEINEHRIVRPDGSVRFVQVRSRVCCGAGGEPKLVQGVVLDLTEQKQAEEALRASEKKYRTLFDSIDEGFCIVEVIFDADAGPVDYRFLETNRAFEKQTGMHDAVGKRMREFVPNHEEHWFEIYGAIARTGVPRRFIRTAKPLMGGWYDAYAFPYGEQGSNQVAILFNDITDRKRTEEALQESKEEYRTLFDSAGDAILIHDLDGKLLDANLATAERLGYSREELLGMHLTDIVTPEYAALVPDRIRKVAEKGSARFETAHLTRDGRSIPVEASARVIPFRGEAVVLAISRDITERKKAEEQLAHQARVFSRIHDAVIGTDTSLRITQWNPAAERLYGWKADEVMGRLARDVTCPDFSAELRVDALRTLRETGEYRAIVRQRRRDGTPIEIEGVTIPLYGDGGSVTGYLALNRDITERKRAEDELRRSREDLDRAQAVGQIGSWRLDIIRNVLTWSDENYRIFGVPPGTPLTYEMFLACVHPDDREYVDTRWKAGLCGEPYDIEHRILADGQVKWVREKANLEFDDAGELLGGFGTTQDITDRKRTEDALMRRTDDLIRQSRELEAAHNEANMYLDIMTHDVRNANNVSSMYADLLLDLAESDLKTYAEKLHASIDRSSEILRNVATIRRAQEETGLVAVNLDAVIRGEIATFPDAAIRYVDPPVSVLANALLSTVFANLIGNAVKYGGPAVEITIRVECDDGTVRVSVEDTGPGVPAEVKEKLFTRFERGRASGRGQGLGLHIVRTLVERYGGSTWVEDRIPGRPEEGAAFRFTLKKAA